METARWGPSHPAEKALVNKLPPGRLCSQGQLNASEISESRRMKVPQEGPLCPAGRVWAAARGESLRAPGPFSPRKPLATCGTGLVLFHGSCGSQHQGKVLPKRARAERRGRLTPAGWRGPCRRHHFSGGSGQATGAWRARARPRAHRQPGRHTGEPPAHPRPALALPNTRLALHPGKGPAASTQCQRPLGRDARGPAPLPAPGSRSAPASSVLRPVSFTVLAWLVAAGPFCVRIRGGHVQLFGVKRSAHRGALPGASAWRARRRAAGLGGHEKRCAPRGPACVRPGLPSAALLEPNSSVYPCRCPRSLKRCTGQWPPASVMSWRLTPKPQLQRQSASKNFPVRDGLFLPPPPPLPPPLPSLLFWSKKKKIWIQKP